VAINNEILKQIEELGVSNLIKPSSKDLEIVLKAYLESKKLDTETFTGYMKYTSPSIHSMYSALKSISKDQKEVTQGTHAIIAKSIDILGNELARDLKPKERDQIRENIIKLVSEARKESQEHRNNILKTAGIVTGGALIITAGVVIFLVSRGRNRQVISEGIKIITKAL
jgi:hypothetical protein